MNNAAFTPPPNDISIEMLREVFGSAINHIVGGSTAGAENAAANMLGTAFGVFNGGVLFFGAIILTWVTVFGLTNTANDGQVLGKKWSSFYTPLRTFTASAFLIPSTSGYSMIQLAILLIASWSIGLASTMWSAVVDYMVDETTVQQVLRSVVDDGQFSRIAANILGMQVCAYAVGQGANQTTGMPIDLKLYRHNKQTTYGLSTTYKTYLDYRDPNWPGSEDICGAVILTTTFMQPDTNRADVNQATATLQGEIANMQGAIGNVRYQAVLDAFASMAPKAMELARVADTPGATFSVASVQTIIDQAREQMLAGIRKEVSARVADKNSGIKQKFKDGGWAMAGSFYRELIAVKDGINSAMRTSQSYVPGTYSADHLLTPGSVSTSVKDVMNHYTSLAGLVLQKLDQGPDLQTSKPTDLPAMRASFGPGDFTDGGTSVKSQIESWFNSLANRAMQGVVFYLGEDGSDPVMQVKNIGDYLAGFGEVVMLSKAAAVATIDGLFEGSKAAASQSVLGTNLSGLLAVGPGVLKFVLTGINEIYSIFSPAVSALMYGGYFLGMWIPMVPFYVFTLGVIGWLVQVIEALAAGALWMVMHLTPERDDSVIGSQQQGYLLLMSLFMRPPLMVLGLVASIAVLTPAIRFVNVGFIQAFRIVQADSVTGLFSIAGYILIYSVIVFAVFMLVFSLPQTLPDRILRWIGGGVGDLGEQSSMSRIEHGASGQARAAVVAGAASMARRDSGRAERWGRTPAPEASAVEPDGARPEGHTPGTAAVEASSGGQASGSEGRGAGASTAAGGSASSSKTNGPEGHSK